MCLHYIPCCPEELQLYKCVTGGFCGKLSLTTVRCAGWKQSIGPVPGRADKLCPNLVIQHGARRPRFFHDEIPVGSGMGMTAPSRGCQRCWRVLYYRDWLQNQGADVSTATPRSDEGAGSFDVDVDVAVADLFSDCETVLTDDTDGFDGARTPSSSGEPGGGGSSKDNAIVIYDSDAEDNGVEAEGVVEVAAAPNLRKRPRLVEDGMVEMWRENVKRLRCEQEELLDRIEDLLEEHSAKQRRAAELEALLDGM